MRPWREYPFLISEALKNKSIADYYFNACQKLLNNTHKCKTMVPSKDGSSEVEVEYALFEHDGHSIVLMSRDDILHVAVWDTEDLSKNQYKLDLFLQYQSMDSNAILWFVERDFKCNEAKEHSDYRINRKVDTYQRDEHYRSLLESREPRDKLFKNILNPKILNRGECIGAAESLRRNAHLCNFLESSGFKYELAPNIEVDNRDDNSATRVLEQVSMSATYVYNRLYEEKEYTRELYEQLNQLYDRGLKLNDTFRFNDSDYSVWRESDNVVCLRDQEILFLITKKDEGSIHVHTTAEDELANDLTKMVCNPKDYRRTQTDIVGDLSILIGPSKVYALGSHLYSLAIDVRCALEAMDEIELDNEDTCEESFNP